MAYTDFIAAIDLGTSHMVGMVAVSYTHLDVYKRQVQDHFALDVVRLRDAGTADQYAGVL